VEERLTEVPELAALSTSVRDESASIEVHLIDKSQRVWSTAYIAAEVGDIGLDIPTVETRASLPASLRDPGGRSGLTIMIRGPDMPVLETLTNEVLRILPSTPGVEVEGTSAFVTVPEYRAIVDPEKAAHFGVTRQAVASALSAAIAPADVSTFRLDGGVEVEVVIQVDRTEPLAPEALGAISIQTNRGTTVRLDQVATVAPGRSLREINRYDRQRQVLVEADVSGRPVPEAIAEVSPKLGQLFVPVGYDVKIVEPIDPLNDAIRALVGPMALAGVLVFIVLAQLYGSLIYPWAVLLCVPMALGGAFLGLRISGNTINLLSVMAMIVLVVLAARQAILLVDHATGLRKRGIPQREAILDAGQTRLRPVLMTGLVLVLALWPLASRAGAGAESRAPMAVVVIWGLVASMVVTLIVVPCAYTYLDDLQRALLRLAARARRVTATAPAPNGRVPAAVATTGGDSANGHADGL
jgi:HAE1 family hydrophobic/amphiphilic exporter-1